MTLKQAADKFNVYDGIEGRKGYEEDRDLPEYLSRI
jgi:hypothetical protein